MSLILKDQVLNLAVSIQQIPAPTFHEEQRGEHVRNLFISEGLSDVAMDPIGNVYARLPGNGYSRPLVLSAHLDTVFPLTTPLKITGNSERITSPGIGDNSLGVAGLFGLVWALKVNGMVNTEDSSSDLCSTLPGDVWLVANVGEEGLGDLKGMKAVVDRFNDQPIAYIVLEGASLGWVYHRGLGVQRYRITARTPGGHSWVEFGKPSAIHELAKLITQIYQINLPDQPRTTLNVGVIQGGTSVNTIAAEASFELDLRSEGVEALAVLVNQVEQLVYSVNRTDVEVTSEMIGQRPVGEISPDHPLVLLAMNCLEEQGFPPQLTIGSTDANIPLSRGHPSVCVGLTFGGGAHTTGEYILTQPLAQGLAQLFRLITGAFQLPEPPVHKV